MFDFPLPVFICFPALFLCRPVFHLFIRHGVIKPVFPILFIGSSGSLCFLCVRALFSLASGLTSVLYLCLIFSFNFPLLPFSICMLDLRLISSSLKEAFCCLNCLPLSLQEKQLTRNLNHEK